MKNLFRIEFLRHRNLAAGFALLNFVVLYYVFTLGLLLHTMPFFVMWLLVQSALGAAFGLFQFGLHKRSNDWLYLLHRPLSTQRIFIALTLAGAAVCLITVALPALLMLLVMEGNGLYGVEPRQYLLLAYIAAIVLSCYLCAVFAQLGSNRLSFLVLVAVFSTFVTFVTYTPHVLLAVVLSAWSLYLAWSSFKPDPMRPPQRPLAWLLTELPIQYGCLWLIVSVLVSSQELAGTMRGEDRRLNPPAGTDFHVRRMPVPDVMLFALQNSEHPDAEFLRQQIPLGEYAALGNLQGEEEADQGALPLLYSTQRLADAEHDVSWIFNRHAMLFAGYDNNSAAFAGWLGPEGFHADATPPPARFAQVPWTAGNEFILDTHNIYVVDWDDRLLHHRYKNTGSDRFTRSLAVGENVTTLLSDSRLYVFRTAELRDPALKLQARALFDTPANDNPDARRFSVLELIDGYLIAAQTGITPTAIAPDFALFGRGQLQLHRTREGAPNELIANMPLESSLGNARAYREFIAAPGMRLLTDLLWGLALGKNAERTWPVFFVSFPAYVWMLAALVCALSAGVTAWLLRRSALPKATKTFWIAGNAFTGLAGLLSFLLGYYWGRKDQLRIGGKAP